MGGLPWSPAFPLAKGPGSRLLRGRLGFVAQQALATAREQLGRSLSLRALRRATTPTRNITDVISRCISVLAAKGRVVRTAALRWLVRLFGPRTACGRAGLPLSTWGPAVGQEAAETARSTCGRKRNGSGGCATSNVPAVTMPRSGQWNSQVAVDPVWPTIGGMAYRGDIHRGGA
jgi:hypothetical protein